MDARRAVGVAKRAGDDAAVATARKAVDAAKIALGERGPVWWDDGAPDLNRHMARTGPYAQWSTTPALGLSPDVADGGGRSLGKEHELQDSLGSLSRRVVAATPAQPMTRQNFCAQQHAQPLATPGGALPTRSCPSSASTMRAATRSWDAPLFARPLSGNVVDRLGLAGLENPADLVRIAALPQGGGFEV
ncbi:hypothetical protein LTR94_027997 [Friedmanniomyces endolithicus]|nr:hypothetical protein LTR94_027997 [Friedmanniomyces endolithicus]